MNLVRNLTRNLTRENINILTACTHERFETGLCKTGYNFYAATYPGSKPWQPKFAPIPPNYYITKYIPADMDMDRVLSHTKFGQFQTLIPVAKQFGLPVVQLEHTLPPGNWGNLQREQVKNMRGDLNVFISEFSVDKWGFSLNDSSVRIIQHGVDTDIFHTSSAERTGNILTVANDFINRDWCLNHHQFMEVTKDINPTIVGDTPGLSEAAKDVNDLVDKYQTHRIYLNTAHISPIPTSLLEAMACGCAIISCNTAAIPDYVIHGYNGLLCNNTDEMKAAVKLLTNDVAMAEEFGKNAAKTIRECFNLDLFVQNWKNLIMEVL
jgi:glycosyltransferase involved in cell wall biosynthesis